MPNKYFIKSTGLLKASGKDILDFINRMSTNDFRKVPADEFRKTVLTTDKGRIIDLINVINSGTDPIILTSYNYQDKVKTHLDKYIIMDDVVLEKADDKYLHIIISGDGLSELSASLFNINFEKNKVYKLNGNDQFFYDDFKTETLNIICPEKDLDEYKNRLKDIPQMNCDEYDFNRISNGVAEGENEFNDQINPMECGLSGYISFTKGCYIGQEVIARLDSQGKIPKQMIRIDSLNKMNKDNKIFSNDKEAGFISSSVNYEGKNAALGFIRSVDLDFEKEYFAENNNEKFKVNINKINQ